MLVEKTLDVVSVEDLKQKEPLVKVVGNGNLFQLLAKASSESQGWMKSTKAMEIAGLGVVVQVTTQQKNADFSYSLAEAITFVPYVKIGVDANGDKKLVPLFPNSEGQCCKEACDCEKAQ